jgi:signal transduction histidine kinase
MFKTARIKLTAWYLLIIMLVSMSFSIVIFRVLTSELDRFERGERLRIERRLPPPMVFDPAAIDEIKDRLILRLIGINVFILAGSALAGYFLAGRTLKPIADMVDEQNRFITDASHELRTPLTTLKSEIEVNLRDPNVSLIQAKKLLKSNLEEVNNLQILSDNLIKLTGNNTIDMGRIQLTGIIKEAIRRVSVAAKAKHIAITNNVPNFTLTGNAMILTELFIILLDNAIKYSARGKSIRITAEKTDGHVVIRVTDQGYGIRKEDISHLFDRFWRADKSRTKTAVPGYGLGLAIGKQIVDRHHGMITVESAVNKGSVFMVTLPA